MTLCAIFRIVLMKSIGTEPSMMVGTATRRKKWKCSDFILMTFQDILRRKHNEGSNKVSIQLAQHHHCLHWAEQNGDRLLGKTHENAEGVAQLARHGADMPDAIRRRSRPGWRIRLHWVFWNGIQAKAFPPASSSSPAHHFPQPHATTALVTQREWFTREFFFAFRADSREHQHSENCATATEIMLIPNWKYLQLIPAEVLRVSHTRNRVR